jgi:hypothetical protein
MENLEAQILTLQYGKDSVKLTKWNIAFSIAVPIVILVIGALLEAVKPEIIATIRNILGLPPITK